MENNNHNRVVDANHSRIVFGPSLSLDEAKLILLDVDYRAPIKRGDLDGIASGSVVGNIDGVFAISPGEIREAVDYGIDVYGAASMAALRAEVSSVIGIGANFRDVSNRPDRYAR